MDFQTGFNLVFGAFSALAGWTLNTLYNSMKELSQTDKDLVAKVQSIEVLVAGHYVPRHEFEIKMDAMFAKLDRIEDKIDHRLDNVVHNKR